jgi:hypothetical protein
VSPSLEEVPTQFPDCVTNVLVSPHIGIRHQGNIPSGPDHFLQSREEKVRPVPEAIDAAQADAAKNFLVCLGRLLLPFGNQ